MFKNKSAYFSIIEQKILQHSNMHIPCLYFLFIIEIKGVDKGEDKNYSSWSKDEIIYKEYQRAFMFGSMDQTERVSDEHIAHLLNPKYFHACHNMPDLSWQSRL